MGAIAAIGGALIQGRGAKKAAQAQERAAQADIAFQKETRDLIRGDLGVYREGGDLAQRALDFELGLGGRPMIGGNAPAIETFMESAPAASGGSNPGFSLGGDRGWNGGSIAGLIGGRIGGGSAAPQSGTTRYRVNGQTFATMDEAQAFANANRTGGQEYGGFTKTPGYDFRLQQGQDSLQAGAAARGGLYSGAAMRDLMKFGQDYGSNEYGNYLSRLGARADTGMSAAQMSGAASQQAAAGVSNALGNIGNAQAAGAIGRANAITGGMQNMLGVWNYQRNLNAAQGTPGAQPTGGGNWTGINGNSNIFNGLFGGKGLGGFV